MKKKYGFLLLALALFTSSAYASVGVQEDGTAEGEATDLNFTTNLDHSSNGSVSTVSVSASPTFTGDVTFQSTLLANGRVGASTQVHSSSTNLAPTNLPWVVVLKNVGAGNGGADATGFGTVLPNGTKGQTLTFIITSLGNNGAASVWNLTPTKATGWSRLQFDTKGDQATILYVDDTIGWIILSNSGAVVTTTLFGTGNAAGNQ